MPSKLLKKQPPIPLRAITRPELNLSKWSSLLFTSSKNTAKSRSVCITTPSGKQIELIIGRHHLKKDFSKYTEVDTLKAPDLIYLSTLTMIWENAGKPTSQEHLIDVRFRDFVTLAQRWVNNTAYESAEMSLKRLKSVPITWRNTFQVKGDLSYDPVVELELFEEMNVLSRLVWLKKKHASGKREPIGFKFQFHPEILRNMVNGHTLPMNHKALSKLKKDVSILCYSHVDTMLSKRNTYRIYSTNLFKQISLDSKRNAKPSNRKRLLENIEAEIVGIPLSTGILRSMKLEWNAKRKDWLVTFNKLPFSMLRDKQDQTAWLDDIVERALVTVGESGNDVTRKFLYKAGHKLGAEAIEVALSRVRADVINDKSREDKPHFGKALWYEINETAKAKNVDLS